MALAGRRARRAGQTLGLWRAVRRRDIWSPTAFLFLWQATPQASQAMFFFQTEELGFTPEFLGRVQLATAIASLCGVVLYNNLLQRTPLRKIFLYSALVGTALSLTQLVLVNGLNTQLGVPNEVFAVADSIAHAVVGQGACVPHARRRRASSFFSPLHAPGTPGRAFHLRAADEVCAPPPPHPTPPHPPTAHTPPLRARLVVAFMPVLVLAARVCPEGVEATLFALLMSICNAGYVSSGLLGGVITDSLGVSKDDFGNLSTLILICGMSSLLPLPLLSMVPSESAKGRRPSARDPRQGARAPIELHATRPLPARGSDGGPILNFRNL